MMADATALRDFYASPAGRAARRLIGARIMVLWPSVQGLEMAGLGYTVPWLDAYRAASCRVLALMPARQGALVWPGGGKRLTALVADTLLPLPDGSLDRVLVVHGLEASRDVRALLRQIWRVLAPGGRVLVVAPNHRGLWAHLSSTPFSSGRAFSRHTLLNLFNDAMLTPEIWDTGLHAPPPALRLSRRTVDVWEWFGKRLWPGFAGVLIVEASKQLYAPVKPQPGRTLTSRRAAVIAGRS